MRKTGTIFRSIKGCDDGYLAKYIRSVGFDNVFTKYTDSKSAEHFANVFARAGLYYESIHAPYKNMNDIWADDESGEAMLGWLMDCLADCRRWNVPIMVVHLNKGLTPPPINDTGRARWDRLVDAAIGAGVKVAFENQRRLDTVTWAMELYSDVPQVGFCWDCGHEHCFANGVEFMKLFGDRLIYTHIHDNMGVVRGVLEHPSADDLHMIPFDGNLDFDRFAEHIREHNYRGSLTLELCPYTHNGYDVKYTPEQFFSRAYDAVSRLVKMC